MKVTIHCEGSLKEINAQLLDAAKVYSPTEERSHISIADIKAARGKGKKGAAAAAETEVDPNDETEVEEEEIETETETEVEEEEIEEEETISEGDLAKVKGALKAYSAKHGDKKKAIAVLHKFAERSDLVKPSDVAKLLKALKV